jgi:bacteriorhodopsin
MNLRKIFEFTSIVFIAITIISFAKSSRNEVSPKYASLLRLSGFTTFVACLHYFLMAISSVFQKDVLSVILYRYADWIITTPVLLFELILLLNLETDGWLLLQLLVANVVMLLFGLYGEIFYTDAFTKITSGLLGFLPFAWIVWKIYSARKNEQTPSSKSSWSNTIAIAFLVIWTLYGVVYFFDSNFTRSILYTILDLISKGAFAAVIYGAGNLLIQDT